MAKRRSKDSITKSVRRTVAIAEASVDSQQLLSDIIAEWGGTGNLARDIKEAFSSAPEGSMIRQRFLEMVQRLIITNTMHDLSQTSEPSAMSDSELDEVASHYITKIADGTEDTEGESHGVGEGKAEGSQPVKGQEESERECAAYVESMLEPITKEDDWDFDA